MAVVAVEPWKVWIRSSDPAGLVDGVGRYSYARGNPVSGRDPSGLDTEVERLSFHDLDAETARAIAEGIGVSSRNFELNDALDSVAIDGVASVDLEGRRLEVELYEAGARSVSFSGPVVEAALGPHIESAMEDSGINEAVGMLAAAFPSASAEVASTLNAALNSETAKVLEDVPAAKVVGLVGKGLARGFAVSVTKQVGSNAAARLGQGAGASGLEAGLVATYANTGPGGGKVVAGAAGAGVVRGLSKSVPPSAAWTPGKQLWSKGKLGEHFAKHGDDVGASSRTAYSDAAKAFGMAENTGQYLDTTVGAFFYRFEPATGNVFVGTTAGQKIKTFYKWDGRDDDAVINALREAGKL